MKELHFLTAQHLAPAVIVQGSFLVLTENFFFGTTVGAFIAASEVQKEKILFSVWRPVESVMRFVFQKEGCEMMAVMSDMATESERKARLVVRSILLIVAVPFHLYVLGRERSPFTK